MKKCIHKFYATTAILLLTLISAGAGQSEVKGTFNGDGKTGNLAFFSAYKGGPRADKGTVVFAFTEKDHSKEPSPEMKAATLSTGGKADSMGQSWEVNLSFKTQAP